MKKVFVFGSNGMLGRYVTKCLVDAGHSVVPLSRQHMDLSVSDRPAIHGMLASLGLHADDVVVNASGIIKQRAYDTQGMIRVNALLPHMLSSITDRLIHITTDCVFSGKKGEYVETDPHDCLDEYGKTKSLGEPQNAMVIRTSIIGEELVNKRSLLEWAISNKGKNVKGFTNHTWNGVTCLALAKYIVQIVGDEPPWKGVRHLFSDDVTKHNLLNMINETYDLHMDITPHVDAVQCHRTLRTIYKPVPFISINEQIKELRQWQGK